MQQLKLAFVCHLPDVPFATGSLVRPKVVQSVHYCEATGTFTQRSYRDATSSGAFGLTTSVYPTVVRSAMWPPTHTTPTAASPDGLVLSCGARCLGREW